MRPVKNLVLTDKRYGKRMARGVAIDHRVSALKASITRSPIIALINLQDSMSDIRSGWIIYFALLLSILASRTSKYALQPRCDGIGCHRKNDYIRYT